MRRHWRRVVLNAQGHYVISPRPKITKIDLAALPKNDSVFLIQACDGIWDMASSSDVAKLANPTLPLVQIAERIVAKALNSGTGDNCSVLVCRIR